MTLEKKLEKLRTVVVANTSCLSAFLSTMIGELRGLELTPGQKEERLNIVIEILARTDTLTKGLGSMSFIQEDKENA